MGYPDYSGACLRGRVCIGDVNLRARLKLLEEAISPDASQMGDSDLRRALGSAWAEVEPLMERIASQEDFENCVREMMRLI